MSSFRVKSAAVSLAMLLAGASMPAIAAAQTAASLEAGFAAPPNSARPRVWWHWMNGNVTKEGIRKDLEWMSRVGIGGVQNFDAALQTPQIVPERLAYMTPAWKDAFRYSANLADQLGLELAVAGSPGWSESGGPWVNPEDGMKKLVWSEMTVVGGRPLTAALPAPPALSGPYPGIAKVPDVLDMLVGFMPKAQTYYGDIAVLAYRAPDIDPAPAPQSAHDLTGAVLDAKLLDDSDYTSSIKVGQPSAAQETGVVIDYAQPTRIGSATLYAPGQEDVALGSRIGVRLEAKTASGWSKVTDITLSAVPTTVSFAPVTAASFRVVFGAKADVNNRAFRGVQGAATIDLGSPKEVTIGQFKLSPAARVNQFEIKAGYGAVKDFYALDADVGPDLKGIPAADIVDLTGKLKPDGTLDWTPPKGVWRVLRLGYSLTGKTNHPATKEATGLEVDKYDGAAVERYFTTYLDNFQETTGPELMGAHGLKAVVIDSIEVGASNWTPDMRSQFKRLRGYDPLPWMPALTGVIIGSRAQSDAFLYDYRRTLSDLLSSEHYGRIAKVAKARGLTVYGEAFEAGRPSLGDDMAMRSHADIPMAALWTYVQTSPRPVLLADMKGAASVAHVYGQNLVAAESLTSIYSPWAFAPRDLKPMMDLEFAYGINRPVIHTSVHQPTDDKVPGLALMIFGQYFNRHETWAEMAKPWVDYMARSAFMLQQGRNVADVAYFYGEEAPLTGLYQDQPVDDAPKQYGFDFVNVDALQDVLSVEGGEIVSKGGARYKALYLGGASQRMTVGVLRRLAQLKSQGANIVGLPPKNSPALDDDPAVFADLVKQVWAPATAGAGRTIASADIEAALNELGLSPDVEIRSGADVLFVHRKLDDGEAYFLSNRKNTRQQVEARFRVGDKTPELWHADTGQMEPVSYRVENGHTVVPLDLAASEAVFVVFRKPLGQPVLDLAPRRWRVSTTLEGAWNVAFQSDRGAPTSVVLPKLASFTESSDPGVRYFSGTSTYNKTIRPPKGWKPGQPIFLDLGAVGDVAQVAVNGVDQGIVWKAPYRLDVSKALKAGDNLVQVKVANLWVNRLIGDAQPGAKKVAWTQLPTYQPDAPLRPAGLLGPVTLQTPEQ